MGSMPLIEDPISVTPLLTTDVSDIDVDLVACGLRVSCIESLQSRSVALGVVHKLCYA